MIGDTSTPFDIRFRFLGFPCNISIFFWIGAALLGDFAFQLEGIRGLLIWMVAMLISILVHELGHAIAARTFGSHVTSVKLIMLGGYCAYDREPRARWKRITISLAGPIAGFILWGLIQGSDYSFSLLSRAMLVSPYLFLFLEFLLFMNLAWGIMNLFPILPLDGGRVSYELCDGAKMPKPDVVARWISVVVAGMIVLYGFMLMSGSVPKAWLEIIPSFFQPSRMMMVWFGILAVSNFLEIKQINDSSRGWGNSSYGSSPYDDDGDAWKRR